MKKASETADDDPLDREIDFSRPRPNPYWLGVVERRCVRLLDADLADAFPDDAAVNEALRALQHLKEAISQRAESMTKKSEAIEDDDPLDHEFDFSNPRPNPYARDYGRNRNLRILAPDLLNVFPDSESVNEALHTLVRIAAASAAVPLKRSARTAVASKPKPNKARA